MERAAAVILGGIGLVLLTLTAVVLAGPSQARQVGRVELAALANRPMVTAPSLPGAPSAGSDGSGPVASAPGGTAAPSSELATTGRGVSADQPPAARPTLQPVPAELVAVTQQISGGGIRFAFGRADLDPSATALLDRLVPMLRARPDVVLLVRGHTDSVGSDDVNHVLSAARAIAVVQYLIGRGVDSGQLQMVGLGADMPVADNATPDGRRANRRTDLSVEGQR
jgi:outer membrane protein OmpA-like peptidoglycan-associated protein